MSSQTKAWLQYWRASLLDADRLQPNDGKARRWVVEKRALSLGRVEPIQGEPSLPVMDEGMDVLVALGTLYPRVRHGASRRGARVVYTCLVPAILYPDYTVGLHAHKKPPFFARDVLEPNPATTRVTLATLDHYDRVLGRWATRWEQVETWQDLFAFTREFFGEVCPSSHWKAVLRDTGYVFRKDEAVVIQSTSYGGAAFRILNVLDELLAAGLCPGALAGIVPTSQKRERRLLWTPAEAHEALHQHLGHMSGVYALSTSQRQALGHFLHGEDQVFAINGPPGTGKTTLLHDVVASLFVQHALENKPPPVIVVSSTNNQAVTNVLDSMSEVGDVHLIPGLATLGVYLSSKSKAVDGQKQYLTALPPQDAKPYTFAGPNALGGQRLDHLLIETPGYSPVQNEFLAAARERHELPESMGVEDVMNWAQSEIKRQVEFMKLGLETYLAQKEGRARVQMQEARKWWERALHMVGLFGQRTSLAEKAFVEAMMRQGKDAAQIRGERLNEWEDQGDTDLSSPQNWLDIHLRRRLFELSVCYYEAKFFVVQKQRCIQGTRHNQRNPQELMNWWRHVAMLTPVFVTTMYSGPRFFQADDKNRAYGGVDLLIVDEAGQVAPELCVGMMALAKRALVVGDIQQLEPIWSVPKPVDWANAKWFQLTSFHNEHDLESTGAMASNGSVMRMAQQASSVDVPDFAPGALLREHRRCPEQIITFCNELAYGGLIRPMKSNNKDGFLPHLGYAHIKGIKERHQGSWRNHEEAYAIAEWIHRRSPELLSRYGKAHIKDVVAVVTPFRAQSELIKEKMADFSDKLKDCTVGTVHSLQGSERPVILFSTVYTTILSKGGYFFDSGVSMLNVAASRSKDSFMVFGDMEIFKELGRLPSNVLARHLLGDDGVEITDIQCRKVSVEKYLLSDLQRHREALKWAIGDAKRELHIASPWITASALKEDDIPGLFKQRFEASGLNIHVYTDAAKIKKAKEFDVIQELLGDNVHLHDCDRLHSKLVICDTDTYMMGSFNWLSSVRRRGNNQFKYYETSIIQTRKVLENVDEWCTQLVDDLQNRVLTPPRWDSW